MSFLNNLFKYIPFLNPVETNLSANKHAYLIYINNWASTYAHWELQQPIIEYLKEKMR